VNVPGLFPADPKRQPDGSKRPSVRISGRQLKELNEASGSSSEEVEEEGEEGDQDLLSADGGSRVMREKYKRQLEPQLPGSHRQLSRKSQSDAEAAAAAKSPDSMRQSSVRKGTKATGKQPKKLESPEYDALKALDNAQEPGVYFKDDTRRENHSEDQEDPALREAVEEAIRLLFSVRGIHHIGPGRDQQDNPVILISAKDGFNAESLGALPEQVRGFATLLALPFDLVPLRKAR
jgi:hypothetical protein